MEVQKFVVIADKLKHSSFEKGDVVILDDDECDGGGMFYRLSDGRGYEFLFWEEIKRA